MSKRILIVEDDALIAMTLAEDLEDAGFTIAGPCMSVAHALHTLNVRDVDAAIVDLDLGRETSAEIAHALKRAELPFVVVSGSVDGALDPPYDGAPQLGKPLQFDGLLKVLSTF